MKIFLIALFALTLPAFADQQITELDSGRYCYYDSQYWVYVWLTDKGDEVDYLVRSVYRPEQLMPPQHFLKNTKKVLGNVVTGATVVKNK